VSTQHKTAKFDFIKILRLELLSSSYKKNCENFSRIIDIRLYVGVFLMLVDQNFFSNQESHAKEDFFLE